MRPPRNPELNKAERYSLYPYLEFEASAQSESCANGGADGLSPSQKSRIWHVVKVLTPRLMPGEAKDQPDEWPVHEVFGSQAGVGNRHRLCLVAMWQLDNLPSSWYSFNMTKTFEMPTLSCLRCGHTWIPRRPQEPKKCPRCASPYWNKPKWKGLKQ